MQNKQEKQQRNFYNLKKKFPSFYEIEDYRENSSEIISILTTKSGRTLNICRGIFYNRFNKAVAFGCKRLVLPGICTDDFIQELGELGFIVGTNNIINKTLVSWDTNAQEVI